MAARGARVASVAEDGFFVGCDPLEAINYEATNPWAYRQRSVDEELADVVRRLLETQAAQRGEEEADVQEKQTISSDAVKRLTKRYGGPEGKKFAAKAKQQLRLEHDPRYHEMCAHVEAMNSEQCDSLGFSEGVLAIGNSLRNQIHLLHLCQEPAVALKQLDEMYEWFQTQVRSFKLRGRMPADGFQFRDFMATEAFTEDGTPRGLPGSAFYVAPPRLADEGGDDVGVVLSGQYLSTTTPTAQHAFVLAQQLAPARERLPSFRTRQLVSPDFTARKLKVANIECESPGRPFTPSTCTGGYNTSMMQSARSTPIPYGFSPSRPSSPVQCWATQQSPCSSARVARPKTATLAIAPDPATTTDRGVAAHLPLEPKPTPCTAVIPRPAVRRDFAAEPNMEERWIAQRQQDMAVRSVGEEQRGAVMIWAERRARVEEELGRNVEAARFQSELWRRDCVLPSDAGVDIEASHAQDEALDDGVYDERRMGNVGSMSFSVGKTRSRFPAIEPTTSTAGLTASSSSPTSPLNSFPSKAEALAPRRFDVSVVDEGQVHATVSFKDNSPKRPRPLNDNIAHLRRLHAQLLSRTGEDGDGGSDSGGSRHRASEILPQSVFDTEDGVMHISLSAYTAEYGDEESSRRRPCAPRSEDDSDVLGQTCDRWQHKHGTQDLRQVPDVSFDALRHKQLEEVEAVKRIFARRNCPINPAAVERGLVMPKHKFVAKDKLFNQNPDLLLNPFPKDGGKSKKAAKKRASKGKAQAKKRATVVGGSRP